MKKRDMNETIPETGPTLIVCLVASKALTIQILEARFFTKPRRALKRVMSCLKSQSCT